MNILVACEESQRVTIEFRNLGHNAFSCDIINSSGGHPEWHINQDVIPLLNGNCSFITEDGKSHFISNKWDMIISFPPCTYLTIAGNQMLSEHLRTFHQISIRKNQRLLAAQFFLEFTKADCERIAIENPVGYMNSYYCKPDQIIHPYFFGDNSLKRTCLWLKGLPVLQPTKILPKPKPIYISPCGKQRYFVETVSNSKIRSKTFPGIANAMATQWSDFSSYYLL